jgi:hypothetical protein
MQRIHISPAIGKRRVDSVTRRDIERLAQAMLARGSAPKTVRNVMTFLHARRAALALDDYRRTIGATRFQAFDGRPTIPASAAPSRPPSGRSTSSRTQTLLLLRQVAPLTITSRSSVISRTACSGPSRVLPDSLMPP